MGTVIVNQRTEKTSEMKTRRLNIALKYEFYSIGNAIRIDTSDLVFKEVVFADFRRRR